MCLFGVGADEYALLYLYHYRPGYRGININDLLNVNYRSATNVFVQMGNDTDMSPTDVLTGLDSTVMAESDSLFTMLQFEHISEKEEMLERYKSTPGSRRAFGGYEQLAVSELQDAIYKRKSMQKQHSLDKLNGPNDDSSSSEEEDDLFMIAAARASIKGSSAPGSSDSSPAKDTLAEIAEGESVEPEHMAFPMTVMVSSGETTSFFESTGPQYGSGHDYSQHVIQGKIFPKLMPAFSLIQCFFNRDYSALLEGLLNDVSTFQVYHINLYFLYCLFIATNPVYIRAGCI